MSTTIATYYTDELADWSNAINFYNGEINEIEKKLGEVVRRNTIIGIAAKVEGEQALLNQVTDKFYRIKLEIELQENSLKTDSTLVENSALDRETENRQHKLRQKMQVAEKEFIDTKFGCYNFLSETIRKQE